jgi:outer membrane lipoprotein SlyB
MGDAAAPGMQQVRRAVLSIAGAAWIAAATATTGCLPTTTTTTTVEEVWAEYGNVESIQQIVRRVEGDPLVGAVAGAVIGGALGGRDEATTLIGAAAGAAIGVSATRRATVTYSYRVRVRFEDGTARVFTYRGKAPFWPGEAVVLTPQGLVRA